MGRHHARETNYDPHDGQKHEKSAFTRRALAQLRREQRLELAADWPNPLQPCLHPGQLVTNCTGVVKLYTQKTLQLEDNERQC